ncbi:MAG: hypothetical protein HN344_06635, partial [Gammaproteobacteria bacterium]|nr:hypothetical protein [Gammaproteobacteria bacterium]
MTTKPIKTEGIFPHSMAWTLLLSGGVLLLPMLLLFSQTIWDKGEEIKRLEQQVQALNWIPDLYASLSQFSQYRGLRAIAAQNPGHYDFAEEHLEQLETDINRTLDQLFNTIETFSDDYPPKAVINENLLRIEQLWLLKQGESFDFTQMSELVEILNHVIARLVSQRPGIQNLLVRDIPNLRESMAQLRGSGGAYLSLFNASSANTLLDSDSAVQIQSRMEQSLWGVSSQFLLLRGSLEDQQEWLDEQALSTLFELVSKIQEVRDLIEWELLDAAEVSFPVDEFFDIATDPIDLLHLLATDLLQHVLQQSMGQLEQLKTERLWMVLLVLITVLFALLLAYRNTRQLITGIQQGIELLQQMGQGHFQQTIEPHARQGEIGLLMDALIETQQLLRENQQQ